MEENKSNLIKSMVEATELSTRRGQIDTQRDIIADVLRENEIDELEK